MDDDSNDTGRTSVDLKGVLNDITFPTADLGSLDVSLPSVETHPGQKDLFEVQKRKSWDKSTEARCDFSYRLRLTRRSDVNFISIWQKTVYGRTLTDIKGDPDMVAFFADNICPVIKEMLGYNLHLAPGASAPRPREGIKSRTSPRSSVRDWARCWRSRSTRMWHFATPSNG